MKILTKKPNHDIYFSGNVFIKILGEVICSQLKFKIRTSVMEMVANKWKLPVKVHNRNGLIDGMCTKATAKTPNGF